MNEILSHTDKDVSFTFVRGQKGPWMVPALCGFGDVALYIQNVPVTQDIANLWEQIKKQELCAVYVPKHEKNDPFPSYMLFRNKYCERLTPAYVYNATPEQLVPSVWAGGPQNIGTLEV